MSAPEEPGSEPIRIVIAEDEAIIRLDLREILEEEGYLVVGECGRGDEAVELVSTLRPDVAILDVKMPGMDGISAAQILSERRLCAVVLLTAFSQRDLIQSASNAGVLAYLVKPFQAEDLVPAIEVAKRSFEKLNSLVDGSEALKQQLEDRKRIDRAKAVLMNEFEFNEAGAFRYLQRQAMDHRVSSREIAERILDGSLTPTLGQQ
ncbi:MAG TPA: response regulator [Acidimicrobiaceae bacterium]|jgi:AmiR/NasT family two-component response regulator|nr:response regulator [Acidimicrobiaceae bacterium]